MKKFYIALFAVLLPALQVAAQETATIDGIVYSLSGEEATISDQDEDLSGDIVIPETVTYNNAGYTVTSLADRAFCATNISTISLPNSITSFGESCFYGCSSLTSITLPDGLTSLGEECFCGCTSLTSITLPGGITSLPHHCFDNCSSLTSVTLPDGITSLGSECFDGCASLASVDLPSGITSLGWGCFEDCASLISITLPSSITYIGDECFCYTGLTKVTVGWTDLADVTTGSYVFADTEFSTDIALEATLYVPKGTKEKYENTEPWSDFMYIIEQDDAAIEGVSLSGVAVSVDGASLTVSGLKDGVSVQLYDLSGRLLSSAKASAGNATLSTVGAKGVVVVKFGGKGMKVML